MRKTIFALLLSALATASSAQVQPSEATTALVQNTTLAFFDLLPNDDFEAERAFMTNSLAQLLPLEAWREARQTTTEIVGQTPFYSAHGFTYYQQDHLIAAIDFSARTRDSDLFVCGYALWEIPEPDQIGLMRLEENVVSVKTFQQMPYENAAQLLHDWRCPQPLVQLILTRE